MRKYNLLLVALLTIFSQGMCIDFALGAHAQKHIEKVYSFAPGGYISVNNINGEVIVESWGRNEVKLEVEIEVRASSKHKAEQYLNEVEIVIDEAENRIEIEAEYPWRDQGFGGILSWLFGGGHPKLKVNYHLFTPKEVDMFAKTVNGQIQIYEVRGDIEARATNGRIEVKNVAGSINCKTVNGSILAELSEVTKFEEMSFKTVNGSITLRLPKNINANFEAKTVNGHIETDFPITLQGRIDRHRVRGRINKGGGSIYLSTVNGSISVREY
ncbi:hypothetical protein DRQ12_04465 [candidate division KSB1 bacterium]|nr:MAG: hypothetical protein DRQ12_04465 [candidate division KSB1 bacterium]